MLNYQKYSIALTMVVSFGLSFTYLYAHSSRPELAAKMAEDSVVPAARAAVEPVTAPGPLAAVGQTGPAAPGAVLDVPREEAPSPPSLPIVFHLMHRKSLGKYEGDIKNISDRTLSLTIQAISTATGQTTAMHMMLDPDHVQAFGTDDGLEIQPRDQIVIQAESYAEKTFKANY